VGENENMLFGKWLKLLHGCGMYSIAVG
jgi:hypothetical protein